MATAKSLTPAEITKALDYIAQNANAKRNRIMFLLTAMAGLRVGEVACLTLGDVRDADARVDLGEVRLGDDARDLDDLIERGVEPGHLQVDPDQVLVAGRQGGGRCGCGGVGHGGLPVPKAAILAQAYTRAPCP